MPLLSRAIHGVVEYTWPMVVISSIIVITLRVTYLIEHKEKFVLYKELFSLSFIIYILCLFQVVTNQDVVSWATNNFIPFKEILRYEFGSKLFVRNVIGNMVMFLPYGLFASIILRPKRAYIIMFLVLVASISIEWVQMAIGRVFDVDDILLNFLGGMLGYFLYVMLVKIADSLPEFLKSEMVLNIISIFLLMGCLTLL